MRKETYIQEAGRPLKARIADHEHKTKMAALCDKGATFRELPL
jgi:hypothetical protein